MAHTTQIELRTAKQVCAQLGGISEVTRWRWVRDPGMKFPQPIKISGRNYFRGDEIDAWIQTQTASRCDDDANNDDDGNAGDDDDDDDSDDDSDDADEDHDNDEKPP